MHRMTPPESVHALDLEALRSPHITVWSVWDGDVLMGCGALKELDGKSGEIKSMRTDPIHRRKGVASRMLDHIIKEAKHRGYQCLNLETGSSPGFAPAQALYRRYGFEYRDPFGEYADDPNSVFMTKKL
ncbi:MAG: GNAT family N-acetyltransferase [Merismopedia sp. SIO2A8]|nr:GNAT family N-acetyltransferase [Merismopedia sp. SIO2A8]